MFEYISSFHTKNNILIDIMVKIGIIGSYISLYLIKISLKSKKNTYNTKKLNTVFSIEEFILPYFIISIIMTIMKFLYQ